MNDRCAFRFFSKKEERQEFLKLFYYNNIAHVVHRFLNQYSKALLVNSDSAIQMQVCVFLKEFLI